VTTERYLHVNKKHLLESMNKFHPRNKMWIIFLLLIENLHHEYFQFQAYRLFVNIF
jgi:hypothetical protein